MIDQRRLDRFQRSKKYRSTYIASRVRLAIALQIKALREQYSKTQSEFASMLEKPQSVVSRLENPDYGKMSVQTLLEIADSLDIALVVKFVSYDKFFRMLDNQNLNARELYVENFAKTVERHHNIHTSNNVYAIGVKSKLHGNELNDIQSQTKLEKFYEKNTIEQQRLRRNYERTALGALRKGLSDESDLIGTRQGNRSVSA